MANQGMEILREALERAQKNKRADDTEQEAKLRAYLDDLHDLYAKHCKVIDPQTVMKSNMAYVGLLLKQAVGPLAPLLGKDLCYMLIAATAKEDKDKK